MAEVIERWWERKWKEEENVLRDKRKLAVGWVGGRESPQQDIT
jgi:hypothetical protein